MIRLPDIPTVPQSSTGAPLMSAQAAAAPAQALGHVAESIASVSGHFLNHAFKIQRMENARQISEARNSLATAYAQHQLDLQTDLDPASRMAKTRAFIAGAQQFIPADAPPEVQDQLGEFMSDWSTRAEISQAEDSSRLAVRRAKAAFETEIQSARSNQDRTQLESAVQTAIDSGLVMPEETAPLFTTFDRDRELSTVEAAITEEPRLILDHLDTPDFQARFPNLQPDDIPRIRRAAEHAIQQKRGEEMDLIESALLEGKLTPADLEAAQYLTPKDISRAKKALISKSPPETTAHSEAWDLLFKLRDTAQDLEVSDPQYAEIWNETRSKVLSLLPPLYQGDIKQELSYRSPANRSVEKLIKQSDKLPASRAADMKSLATQRIKQAYDNGLLGNIKDPKSTTAKQAFSRFEDARLAVWDHIQRHPETPWPEVRDLINKTLGATVTDSRPLISIPSIPPPVSFDTRASQAIGMPDQSAPASAALLPPL